MDLELSRKKRHYGRRDTVYVGMDGGKREYKQKWCLKLETPWFIRNY